MFENLKTKAACAAHAAAVAAGHGYDNVTGIFSRKPKPPTLEQMIAAEVARMSADPAFTPEMAAAFRTETYNAALAKALEALGVSPLVAKYLDFSVLFRQAAA